MKTYDPVFLYTSSSSFRLTWTNFMQNLKFKREWTTNSFAQRQLASKIFTHIPFFAYIHNKIKYDVIALLMYFKKL